MAIIGVLMDHDEPWQLFGASNARFHEYGGLGLYLFFAISGLLVTTRILEDEALLGSFRIKAFYIRRFFRIQPAEWVYLAAIALLDLFQVTHERLSALLGGLFLYQNYLYNPADHTFKWVLTGHFWTLAVEEHFYLLLSALLFFVRSRRVLVFALLFVALALWPALSAKLGVYSPTYSPRATELQLQFLIGPALVALLLRRKQILDLSTRFLHPFVAIWGVLLFKVLWYSAFTTPGHLPRKVLPWLISDPYILLYGFTFWVVATMLHPRSWMTRFLELRPLRFVGRLSYSLYLWHVLFTAPRFPELEVHARWLLFLTGRPWRYLAIAAASLLSYYFVEKPMIRLGHRLAPPATPGHRDLLATPSQIPATSPN